MAQVRQDKQVEARRELPLKPSAEALPDIAWLPVADLLVDYAYQHRPYASAIEALRKEYQEAHSGFILVNQREDGTYWIIDGQTRQEVHRGLGLRWIRAEIIHGLTQAEEASVYLLKCINAKRMPVDFFLAEYMARRPEAVLIHDLLEKRSIEIESYASTQRKRGTDVKPVVTCVTYLKRMIHRDPQGEILGMTLDLIRDTWDYSGNTLTGIFLDAMHKLLTMHADEIDRNAFIAKLGGCIPEDLRQKALLLRLGTQPQLSVGTAIQRVIIDLYNSGPSGRQPTRRITLGSPHSSTTL